MSGQNAEIELVAQLKSEKRSVKIQAIVKLTRVGQSELALRALVPLLNSDDREISFFASQAAAKVAQKAKLDLNSFLTQTPTEPATETKKYTRSIFLAADKEKIPELLAVIRTQPELIPEDALPAVGVFLSRHGDASDGAFIEKLLSKENSNLALPLLGAAESIAPTILPRVLPNLLASREPLVRSRSISALRKIDPEEAERHFSDLLASRDPENRLAGIGISFLFPFDRVRGYLLSILPEESDSDVLTACQTVLASNPDVDTALNILDSIDAVAAEQKSRLSLIFRTVCQALAAANIMPPEQCTPEMIVGLWKKQRLEAFLYDLEIQLSFADEKKKKSIVVWIERNRQHLKVQELIQRLSKNPQTEEIYRQLCKTAKAAQTAKAVVAEKKNVSNESVTPEQKIVLLKDLELEAFQTHKSWIINDAKSGSPELRAEALNTLLRVFPEGKLIDLAKSAIDDENVEVRTAGFKVLERLDSEYLQEMIPKLLLEKDANLRVRAVRFALKYKENEAIEALKRLLKDEDQNIRSNAVNCLALCPFTVIFSILMDQLDREQHPVIARQITSILLNNASKPVLKALDNVTRTSNPAVAMVISQARNDLFELVAQMPEVKETVEATEQAAQKPYSLSNVRELARKNQNWQPSYKATESQKTRKVSEYNWQMIISGSVLIIFLAMLPIMLLSKKEQPIDTRRTKESADYRTSERVKPLRTEVPEKFRMNRPCALGGTIERVVSDTSLVMVHDGHQIMVKFDTPEVKTFSVGDKIEVTVVPYGINPNGIILSKGQKIVTAKVD